MGPVIDILSKNFRSNYHPGREVAIDEMMIGTRCRTSFIQYMPKKPVKFGIKMWALCELKTGYCLEFQLYKGRENDTAEKGLTFRVCTDLMKNYYGKNHHLYTDNFYTSCALYNHLEKHDKKHDLDVVPSRKRMDVFLKISNVKNGRKVQQSI